LLDECSEVPWDWAREGVVLISQAQSLRQKQHVRTARNGIMGGSGANSKRADGFKFDLLR
jgi:hypothetical protein